MQNEKSSWYLLDLLYLSVMFVPGYQAMASAMFVRPPEPDRRKAVPSTDLRRHRAPRERNAAGNRE